MSNLRTAAQQALEALDEAGQYIDLCDSIHPMVFDAADALKAALEQPEREPVAIVSSVTEPGQWGVRVRWLGGFPQIAMKLYTHPPRREWRGLTEEEISEIFEAEPRYHYPPICATDREFARAIEAALKERNS